jgi:hypothetical protein
LSNAKHPEYGQITIPFPIPKIEYDRVIETLERMEIGDAVQRDCRVDEITSDFPILKRLEKVAINVDELDYLAKRLDSFDTREKAQFQAMAVKLGTFDMTDFINLTFCCQQATVITDFSDLEKIGRNHIMTVNGGAISPEELDQADNKMTALSLILHHAGTVTPYGVVYDNGMRLERFYDGQHFPEYRYDETLMTLEVPILQEHDDSMVSAWLYLPASNRQIDRALQRIGIQDIDASYEIVESTLPLRTAELAAQSFHSIKELNKMCEAISALDRGEHWKLDAVIEMAQPENTAQITYLAENLDLFDFISGIRTPEDYGKFMIQQSGHYDYDENLEEFYDYGRYAQQRIEQENGIFTEQGYLVYHGTLSLDELMMDEPTEQEFGMGGF